MMEARWNVCDSGNGVHNCQLQHTARQMQQGSRVKGQSSTDKGQEQQSQLVEQQTVRLN